MAQEPRIEFPGAIYRLIGRGYYRKPVFEESGVALSLRELNEQRWE